jgi:hypothetical protein
MKPYSFIHTAIDISPSGQRRAETRGRKMLFCLALDTDTDPSAIIKAHKYPFLILERRWPEMGTFLRLELLKILGRDDAEALSLKPWQEIPYPMILDMCGALSRKAAQLLEVRDPA